MLKPDICANQTLDAMAMVCNCHVVTYTGDSGYTLEAIDLDNYHQVTIHADSMMDAVMELTELLGADWEDSCLGSACINKTFTINSTSRSAVAEVSSTQA